jgi:alkylation response protein AidB-like acyl-CoA dehydrogenase
MPTLTADPALLELVAAEAADSERAGALTVETVDAIRTAGIFRSLVPAVLGGGEADPRELLATVDSIAAADGSAGWCAAIGATSGLVAGYLPTVAATELFGDADSIGAGAFAPRGELVDSGDGTEGTVRISGRWPLASGVSHATSVGLGCMHPDHGPLYAVVPRAQVDVIETWDSLGLRATASHDVTVEGLEIPAERAVALIGGTPTATGPLYSFPLFGLLALAISAVCTGIARGALADVVDLAGARRPVGSSRSLAERATTQADLAAAEGALRAARAGVAAAIEPAWISAGAGRPLTVEERLGLRLASTHAARTAVGVVDAAHRLGGASALYRGSTLERRLRDVHTAAQHMMVAPATLELLGRLLLGLETDVAQL